MKDNSITIADNGRGIPVDDAQKLGNACCGTRADKTACRR
jgi:DNA gyrase/topoisomerase IV subunit B